MATAPPLELQLKHSTYCYRCGRMLPVYISESAVCAGCGTETHRSWFQNKAQQFNFEGSGSGVVSNVLDASEIDMFVREAQLFDAPDPEFDTILANARAELLGNPIVEEEKVRGGGDPVIKKECVKCFAPQMTYKTMQTRSADEGQTVIYTCYTCGAKEIEYA